VAHIEKEGLNSQRSWKAKGSNGEKNKIYSQYLIKSLGKIDWVKMF
jgi:hypothetical protein